MIQLPFGCYCSELSNTKVNYNIVQNEFTKMYLNAQVDLTILFSKLFVTSQIKSLSTSRELNSLFVNVLLNPAHIFSAGLSSGLYGGKNSNAMFAGMIKDLALWKAPLSSTITLNSSGFIIRRTHLRKPENQPHCN